MKFLKPSVSLILMMSSGVCLGVDIPQAYANVARYSGVPKEILYAVALTESSRKVENTFLPWPWTLNIEGTGMYFESKAEMIDSIGSAMFEGKRSIDIGALQINLKYHHHRFNEVSDMAIPEENLNVASEILLEQYFKCELDWWCAVGRYHSPGNKKRADAYSSRVRKWFEKL